MCSGYVENNRSASGVNSGTLSCTHQQPWHLSVGQCGCAEAERCAELLCPDPPVPRPRPGRILASAAAESRVRRAQLEGEKTKHLLKMLKLQSVNEIQHEDELRTQMVKVFWHEAHSDVQEDLMDAWSSQRGLEQWNQDLQDRRELLGDPRWPLYQKSFQQTHGALQLHVQLRTTKSTAAQ